MLLMGLCCSLSVLIESTDRIKEYSVFILPRIMPGAWDFLKQFTSITDIPYGLNIIFAISIACLINIKENYRDKDNNDYLIIDKALSFVATQLLDIK